MRISYSLLCIFHAPYEEAGTPMFLGYRKYTHLLFLKIQSHHRVTLSRSPHIRKNCNASLYSVGINMT